MIIPKASCMNGLESTNMVSKRDLEATIPPVAKPCSMVKEDWEKSIPAIVGMAIPAESLLLATVTIPSTLAWTLS